MRRQSGTALGTGAAPARFKPPRDRQVPSRTVVCQDCASPVGAPCVSVTDGHPLPQCHKVRRRMAIRAENERG